MGSQVPSPYSSIKSRLETTKKVVISAGTFKDLIAKLEADRIISGDYIEETPSPAGRTLSGTAGGGEGYSHPFKVSTLKKEGQWYVRIATNGGTFADCNGIRVSLPDMDEKDNIEKPYSVYGGLKFSVSLVWEYDTPTGEAEISWEIKAYASAESELRPVIKPVEGLAKGKSRVVLAIGEGTGTADDNRMAITQQLVHTSLRARWAAVYKDPEDPDKVKAAQLAIPYISVL